MKIYLMRHGEALSREEALMRKIEDGRRPLVPKGKSRTKKMIEFVKNRLDSIDLLVTSPLLRAQQTTEIVKEFFPITKLAEVPELSPESPPVAFSRWLRKEASQVSTVFAVGHEPHLSLFVSHILADKSFSFVQLKKSGLICLEVESFDSLGPTHVQMKWLLDPRLI